MNSAQAKKIPIVQIMERLGHQPVRKDKGGVEWVYNSPFRKEKEPSLFVNIQKNVWNDFGDIGGNALDFVMRYRQCGVSEALDTLDQLFRHVGYKPSPPQPIPSRSQSDESPAFVLDEASPLSHSVLTRYLAQDRAIDPVIARNYVKEVNFHNSKTGKHYFAIGFENLSGGYEIRNAFFKSSLGKKDLSILKGEGGGEELLVFEGFMDFLSYLTDINRKSVGSDVLILNSVSFTQKAKQLILAQGYSRVLAFLDNDKKGIETLASLQELPVTVIACNHRYEGFKDYNEYLKNGKNTQKGK